MSIFFAKSSFWPTKIKNQMKKKKFVKLSIEQPTTPIFQKIPGVCV